MRLIFIAFLSTAIMLSACGRTTDSVATAADVPDRAEDVRPLLAGTPAPEFTVRQADGSEYRFTAGKRDQPAVIVFYRGGWCPYCSAHLGELRKIENELLGLGYELLFLSADKPEKVQETEIETDYQYTLLSDSKTHAAQAFGIAFKVDDATIARYQGYGIDLEAVSGETHHLLPAPAVFIVGTDGLIHFQYVNPNYQMRIAPEVLLAAARAAQDTRNVRERVADKK